LTKRQIISKSVNELLSIDSSSELYNQLISSNIGLDDINWFVDNKKRKNGEVSSEDETINHISELFDLGGIITGGSALAYITNKFFSKDLDFYFNDKLAYLKAVILTLREPTIDINYYIDDPCELHDLSIVMCGLKKDGPFITEACQRALDIGISDLYISHVIFPERTAIRMEKYNKRLGIKFRFHEVIAFCALYNLNPQNLLSFCI